VPGFEAFAGRLSGKSKYFSLPFNSLMLMVIGNLVLNAVTVALLYNVAVNVLAPTVILSFILSVFSPFPLLRLLVVSLLLLQAKS
jgi:hypothetical protein